MKNEKKEKWKKNVLKNHNVLKKFWKKKILLTTSHVKVGMSENNKQINQGKRVIFQVRVIENFQFFRHLDVEMIKTFRPPLFCFTSTRPLKYAPANISSIGHMIPQWGIKKMEFPKQLNAKGLKSFNHHMLGWQVFWLEATHSKTKTAQMI